MASVDKRERNGKITWHCRWRDPQGFQRKKEFAKRADAVRFAATVEASKATGTYVDHTDPTTVAEFAWQWAESRPHRRTTAQRTASLIRHHIAATRLGDRRLVDVRPSEVQAWATDRGKILSPSTLRGLVGLLRSVYAAAVLDGLVARSPVVRVSLPRADRHRVVPLSIEQVHALADALPDRYRAMVITQAGTGLRMGELLALRVSDVDFLRRAVRVDAQLTKDKQRVEPKTPKSRRVVPLPDVVAEALAAHVAAYPPDEDGVLFTSDRWGGPLTHQWYGQNLFGAAAKRAGLPAGTTTHDLRHHYASVLLAAGESVVAVAERLGHENANLVLSVYGHLMPDSEDRTRRAVDVAWRSCAPNVPQQEPAGR